MKNVLNTGYTGPDVAKAAENALIIKRNRIGNQLAEKKLGSYDEDRATQKKMQEIQTEAQAISTALRAGDTDQATNIYKSLGGKSKSSITIAGPNVSMDYGDNVFSGPGKYVAELMENIAKNPAWANDPKTKAWSAARGISSKKSPSALAKQKASFGGADKRGQALKRISGINKSIATLEKTDMVTQMLAKDNPELAQYIGQKIPPELKAGLMEAWNNELDYLHPIAGTSRKKKTEPTGSTVTHTFIPGQGLVPK